MSRVRAGGVRPAGWLVLVGLLAATLTLLAGCGSSGPPTQRTAADPRSNPCALLTSAQLRQLRFGPGQQQQAGDELGGTACVWTGYPLAQGPRYTARLLAGPVPGGSPSAAINNLPTVQYIPPGADQRTHCGFLISVGSGQTLAVQFADANGGVPGLSHQVACNKAQAAASDMASTLSGLRG